MGNYILDKNYHHIGNHAPIFPKWKIWSMIKVAHNSKLAVFVVHAEEISDSGIQASMR